MLILLLLGLGIALRLYRFGRVPDGLNQDEAFAGYEAYSLLNYGIDSGGYHGPVYLLSWGSGMNALNSCLMMPFVHFFGLSVYTVRLPQVILGIISLFIVYLLTKHIYGPVTGIAALGLLAVSPWHVMLSRWGLESNLAPCFVLAALYFFVLGIENNRWYLLSAFLYGLSLYTYATLWVMVPVILAAEIIYLIISRKLSFNVYSALSVLILFVMALPLILFVLVNLGYLDEIRTPLISIPKVLVFRSGDVSFKHFGAKLKNLCSIFIRQSDGLPWNYVEKYGFLGYVTLFFSLSGLGFLSSDIIREIRDSEKKFSLKMILLINFLVPLLYGTLIAANITRINILFIPMIIFAAAGITRFRSRYWLFGISVYYLVFTLGFAKTYFRDYNVQIRYYFGAGFDEALAEAKTHADRIYLSSDIHYPKVLFYDRIPVTDFRESVIYKNYPASFLLPQSFLNYSYSVDPSAPPDEDGAYIIGDDTDTRMLEESGFSVIHIGRYKVFYK